MNDDTPSPCPPAAGSQRFIIAGFAVVLVLLATLALLAIGHMASLKEQTATLISENNVKTESVYTMSRVARERFASLGLMTMLDDPFERDEEYLRLLQQAATFIVARDRLHEAGLSPAEQAIWARIRPTSGVTSAPTTSRSISPSTVMAPPRVRSCCTRYAPSTAPCSNSSTSLAPRAAKQRATRLPRPSAPIARPRPP